MTVVLRGTDSSGRPIRSTDACWAAWDAACDVLGFVPTIVQGGHMGSSGAAASAGTHAGDAFDVRLWDRLDSQRADMIRVFRAHGFAYWERYPSQGFDLHAHMIPGPWASPAPEALRQWSDYLASRDGLASHGADYHPRPTPLVTKPPPEEDMPYTEQQLAGIVRAAVASELQPLAVELGAIKRRMNKIGENAWERDTKIRKALTEQGVDLDTILAQLDKEN